MPFPVHIRPVGHLCPDLAHGATSSTILKLCFYVACVCGVSPMFAAASTEYYYCHYTTTTITTTNNNNNEIFVKHKPLGNNNNDNNISNNKNEISARCT